MKIKILVGISGSTKSTYAEAECHLNCAILSRDNMRETLFNLDSNEKVSRYYKDFNNFLDNEKKVTEHFNSLLKYYVDKGWDVIVDNTNCNKKYLDQLIAHIQSLEYKGKLEYILFDTTVDESITRIESRERKVNRDVIERQFTQLEAWRHSFLFDKIIKV